jgi:glutaredoxin
MSERDGGLRAEPRSRRDVPSGMKRPRKWPILMLLALAFGIVPVVGPRLHEFTRVQGHGRQVAASVTVYGTRWCPYCRQAREYLQRHAFDYVEHDIEASDRILADFHALGGNGIPLIVLGDERMQGFSPAGFEALLQRAIAAPSASASRPRP